MNKVIIINLGGTAYQLEEGGYDALRAYLETAGARLQGNPDRDEIISDIERAIAEKFRAVLTSQKTVVETREVADILAAMGPVEAEPGEAASSGAGAAGSSSSASGQGKGQPQDAGGAAKPRRLYRIYNGAIFAGVCTGIAAYFDIDVTIVRLAFVLLMLVGGSGVLAYIVMAIVVPEARSPEEKAAASGFPATAQEFIRRAKEGYYEAVKGFPDRAARREWKRRFKREMRANADRWWYGWHGCSAEQAPVHPGMGFTLPFLSLLQGTATILWICALISLLSTGAVLGMALSGNVPVWVAALLLTLTYGIISVPLKAARRSCYWGLGRHPLGWSLACLMDALIWIATAIVLLGLAMHFFPDLKEGIRGVPSVMRQAAEDIATWWKGR